VALHWWSIEVRDGSFSAQTWRDAHGEAMIEAAITHGAREWGWVNQPWGTVFEVAFAEPEDWTRYRDLPAVRAALDAVPDRINGLYIYPGRGGSAGAGKPRRPRLPRGAGAAPVPEEPSPVLVAGRPPAEFQPPTISVAS
jgi:hypothetical protein